jgi:hypothetical protein
LDAARRRRGAACLSDLTLDRLALGEISDLQRAPLLAHLSACPACEGAQRALAAERDGFAREVDVPALAADALARAARAPAVSWLRRLRLALTVTAAAAAAAAALLLVPWPGGTLAPDPGQTLRRKGDLSLAVFVKHAEAEGDGLLHMGEPLHPGDRLRFQVNSDRDGHLVVLSVDAAAKVSVFYPRSGESAAVHAGGRGLLPDAIELDGTLGPEVIVALRCPSPLAPQLAAAAARRALDPRQVATRPAAALGPLDLGCAETRYELNKVALPATPAGLPGR